VAPSARRIPISGSALGHGNRERVVDDEHPDEQREQAGDAHHHRVGGGHRLELPAASRGRIHLEARSEQRPQLVLHLRDGAAGLHADVDSIERPAAPEHPLGSVDVHDREVAAERRRQTRRFHDAADRERPLSEDRAEWDGALKTNVVPVGEIPCDDDRVGLRQEDQRVVDDRLVGSIEIVVAQAAVAGHVDAQHEERALAGNLRVDGRFDDRHRDPHRGRALDRLEHGFVESCFAGRYLELGLARDAIDGAIEREENALAGVCIPTKTATPRTIRGRQDRAHDVLAKYAS
jgi:hypothetical protein